MSYRIPYLIGNRLADIAYRPVVERGAILPPSASSGPPGRSYSLQNYFSDANFSTEVSGLWCLGPMSKLQYNLLSWRIKEWNLHIEFTWSYNDGEGEVDGDDDSTVKLIRSDLPNSTFNPSTQQLLEPGDGAIATKEVHLVSYATASVFDFPSSSNKNPIRTPIYGARNVGFRDFDAQPSNFNRSFSIFYDDYPLVILEGGQYFAQLRLDFSAAAPHHSMFTTTDQAAFTGSFAHTGDFTIDFDAAGSVIIPLYSSHDTFSAGATAITTSATLTPKTWWTYKNKSGASVYDAATGAQINDPFG